MANLGQHQREQNTKGNI